jgi:hypothetical protein
MRPSGCGSSGFESEHLWRSRKLEEDQIYRRWLEAGQQYAYPGTVDDWRAYFGDAGGGKAEFGIILISISTSLC